METQGLVTCWTPRYHQSWKSVGLVVASTLVVLALLWNAWERASLLGIDRVPASTEVKRNPPRTLFVFLAGVEGTGHHFYEKLYNEQSNKLRDILGDGELALQQDLLSLQTSLYNDAMPETALLTGALAYKKKNVHPDGHQIFQSFVQQLNTTNAKVLRWLDNDQDRHSNKNNDDEKKMNTTTTTTAGTTFPIPLNAILVRAPVGMMSYPNYLLPSRPLQYPDLHLLYRACDAAQVSCGHVYLHRDPYEVIGRLWLCWQLFCMYSSKLTTAFLVAFGAVTKQNRVHCGQTPIWHRRRPDCPVHDHDGGITRSTH
jgi:hypothetical protein